MSPLTISTYGSPVDPQLGAVKPWVKAAAETIAAKFNLTTMSGYRATNSVDPTGHPAGLAIDIPSSRTQGDAVAAWVTANAGALGVKYVIWQQADWYPGKGWAPMATRAGETSSNDVNHLRHVHVSFNATGPATGLLDQLRAGLSDPIGTIKGALSTAADALNPFAGWQQQATSIGIKVAVVVAGLGLLLLGANRLVMPAVAGAVKQATEAIS